MTDTDYPHQNVIENFKEQTGKPLVWLTTASWSEFEVQYHVQNMAYYRELDEMHARANDPNLYPCGQRYGMWAPEGYDLKKLWDEAKELREALIDAPQPPDAEAYYDEEMPYDYSHDHYVSSAEENKQWVEEVGNDRTKVHDLDAQLRHQYETEGDGEPYPGTQIGGHIINMWNEFDDDYERIDVFRWAEGV